MSTCDKCGVEIDPKFYGHMCEALINEEVPDSYQPDRFELMGEAGCEGCERLAAEFRQLATDSIALLEALGFPISSETPTTHEVLRKIEVLQEAKRMGAQWCEALHSCAEILSVPVGSSISTGVVHAVAELREQSDSRALTILMLQSKL